MRKLYLSVVALLLISTVFSQTTLISPTGDGGFETGTDFTTNGWTVANGAVTNKWFVGSVASGFSNRAAYVSNDAAGATWNYSISSVSVAHFYRDVTFPAGQTDITLSFDWAALGETSNWDALLVSVAPTSYTPVATTTSLGQSTLAAPATTIAQLWTSAAVQSAILKIPSSLIGNCTGAATVRIIFTWKNDGSGGVNPPAAVDNISLTSQAVPAGRISAAGGTFTINQTLPNTGSNFTTFSEAVTSLNAASCNPFGSPVTFNVAANQTFSEIVPAITASGSAGGAITFQKGGSGANPVVLRTDGGTVTTSAMGGQGDGVITIDGTDYITFNQIDVSASDQGIEYGYYLRRSGGTNGCKNVTIKNASVMMTRGTSTYVTGIYSSNLDASSAANSATGVTVTSVGGRSENVTITGNTISNVFHGMQLRGFAAATPYDFYDQNFVVGASGAGNGNTINNFGGNSTTAVYGIYINNHNNAIASYNTVNNTDNGGTASTGSMYGIYNAGGTTAAFMANNNSLTLESAYASGSLVGIYNSGVTGNLTVNNNSISLGANITSTSATVAFIYNGGATAATSVSFNNNSFSVTSFASNSSFYLIYNSVTNAAITTIQNNQTSGVFTATGTGALYCYYNASSPTGTDIFSGNNFSNITCGSSFYGYYTSTAAAHRRNAFNNTFTTIVAGGGTMYGIYKGSGISNIYNNKIADFTSNATSSSVYGIYILSGVKDSIYNNIVGDLKAPSASTASNAVVGLYIPSTSATSAIGVYYNTVYLSATSGGANFGTSAIYTAGSTTATTATLEMKNNIFINNSQSNGTGYVAVFRRSLTGLANYATSSNNNLFYTASPGGNIVTFYDGTNTDLALADFKNRVTPRETSSVSENPNFISINPTDATYLHISNSTPTQIESGGSPVSGITSDFDGNVRNAGTPDIGADEFTGISVDLTGPSISYTPVLAACATGDRAINGVVITDASGVPVSGTLVPRIYYRKGAGAWFSKPGTLASGSTTNGVWNFNIVAADLGGVAFGNVISYYIIAQDVAPTPNITSNPSGATASNVNTVTAPPSSSNTYIVGASLAGSYNIGSANTLKTLANAVAIYNGCPITAAVTFNLTDPSYPEDFPVVIGTNTAASAVNTFTIRPASGVAVNISGASTSLNPTSIFRLDGADYVTIDGINSGGSSMIVENTSTVAGSAVIWLSSLGTGQGATNNTIKKLTLKGGVQQLAAVTTSTYGIVVAGNSLNSAIGTIAAGDNNNNNVLDSNLITTVRYGIYTRGGSATNLNTGNIIRNNIIGPSSFDADRIGKGGVVVREEDGIQITRNHIGYIGGAYADVTTGTDRGGIFLSTDAVWTPTNVVVKNASITRNEIHDIVEERTFSGTGIALASADGTNPTNNVVANNMIYNVLANGTSGDQVVGIGIAAGKGDKIVYNSILLTGDTDPGGGSSPSTSSFGISITASAVTDLMVLDNIVNMDLSSSSAPALKHAAISIPTAYVWGTGNLDYNNLYINPSNTQSNIGVTGGSGGTFYPNLGAWRTATSKEAHSKDLDPQFVSPTDLHLQSSSPLDLQGTPVAGITNDYDGQTRDASLPDIGADEINVSNCAGAVGGTATAANATRCASDSTVISVSGFSTGTSSGYQWQSSTDNSTFTDIPGITGPGSFNTHGLTATTYYKLKVTCASGLAVAYSNTVTVTVNQQPTVTLNPAGPVTVCAPANPVLNVSSTSASSPAYQWQLNGADVGNNTSSYTATASGGYSVKVTDGVTTCSRTSPILVTINPQPSAVSITPSASALCANTDPAVLLTASGGTVSGITILAEDFNGSTNPWTTINNTTGGTAPAASAWTLRPDGYVYNTTYPLAYHSNDNSQFMHTNADPAGSGSSTEVMLTSPAFSTLGYTAANLSFYHFYKFRGADVAYVEVSTNGTAWTTLQSYTGVDQGSYAAFVQANISLAAYINLPTVYVRFRNVSAWGFWWAIDNVAITGDQTTGIKWTPVTGLYTNAAATTPYAGGTTSSVYAKPTTNTIYTATATSAANCPRTQTVSITSNCVVPVTLLNFKGERLGSVNKLEWTTVTEINNKGFELQRSADGREFSQLAFVATKATNGNSTASLTYNFDDVKPLTGNGYYRLKQLDKDGLFTYSNVVVIKRGKIDALTLSSIYPNPVHVSLNLIISSPASDNIKMVVTDVSGKIVMQKNLQVATGDNQFKLPVMTLASGSYFIKAICANGCETAVQKFVKQ